MSRVVIVRPGAGAPGLLTPEAWAAISRSIPLLAPGDPLAERLREIGIEPDEIPEADPILLRPEAREPQPAAPGTRLPLVAGHGHGETPPGARALAARLAEMATARGEAVFVAPTGVDHRDTGETVVRAVMERAMAGDLEVEVVIGRPPRGHRLLELVAVMARLRGPGGCPWDREQTHVTLARYLLDETYELMEAIESGTSAEIEEELGDLALQIVFHSEIANESGTFDVDDVAGSLVEKLIGRHPHVFGDVEVAGAGEVVRNWDEIKKREKQRGSVLDGVPESLPALAYAQKLLRRAGVSASDAGGEASEAVARVAAEADERALGEALFALVALARTRGLDAEGAMRRAARAFRDRVRRLEEEAARGGRALSDLGPDEIRGLWR